MTGETSTLIPIGDVRFRERVHVRGRVRSVRVQPWADSPTLEVVLVDETGGITVVFLARRRIGGVRPGSVLRVEGMVGAHHNRLAILNPEYELEHVS
jgi:RecG-like helicase